MSGQAMSEMIIVSLFFLVPLFLFMTMIMKYLDMRSSTLQASRYAAFERTVYSASGSERDATMAKLTDAQLANGIKTRFFGNSADTIKQTQNDSNTGFTNIPLWSDAAGNKLVNTGAVANTTNNTSEPLVFAADKTLQVTLGNWSSVIPSQLSGLNGFKLNYDKYYNMTVSVSPTKPSGPVFANLPALTFTDNDTILADGWSASSITYEHDQAQNAVPTTALKNLFNIIPGMQGVIDLIGKVGLPDLFGGLGVNADFFKDSLGYVVVDKAGTVPADRLANYTPGSDPGGGDGSNQQATVDAVIKQFEDQGYTLVSQTTNSDGSVTLVFSKNGATITQTVGGSGSGSNNTQTVAGTVYNVTNQTISSLQSAGYTLTSGPSWSCGASACPTDTNGNPIYTNAVSASATLTKTINTGSNTVTSTINLTVKNSSTSGYVDVTEVTSN